MLCAQGRFVPIVELRTEQSGRNQAMSVPAAGSRQIVEQPLRFFEIGGVEALGEPAVEGREQVARLASPALLVPEAGEACGGRNS